MVDKGLVKPLFFPGCWCVKGEKDLWLDTVVFDGKSIRDFS